MDIVKRLDDQHAAALELIPPELVDVANVEVARTTFAAVLAAIMTDVPAVEGVTHEDHHIPGAPGDPDVLVRVYRPVGATELLPTLLWFHAGGMVLGNVDQDDIAAASYVRDNDCVVASVDYRLSPEHPFPAPINDGYAALKWLAESDLGIDRHRIAVGGASAGAGLAAGIALIARDRGEIAITFQLLIYPMLDDRNITPSSHSITDPRVWNRSANQAAWSAYLGESAGGADVSEYAAPARATDLSDLPPTYIAVGDLDLFLDENINYAQRLLQAGVPTELHVYPGAFHGSDIVVPTSPISQRWASDRNSALQRAFARVT